MADLIVAIIYLVIIQSILFYMSGLFVEAKLLREWDLAITSLLVCIACEVLSYITIMLALKDLGFITGFNYG
nr:MAG TPA: hypothetical protein [Caudoviricetes sp.]